MLPFIHAMHASDNPIKRFYDNELFDRNVVKIIYEMLKRPSVEDVYYIPDYDDYDFSEVKIRGSTNARYDFTDQLPRTIDKISYIRNINSFKITHSFQGKNISFVYFRLDGPHNSRLPDIGFCPPEYKYRPMNIEEFCWHIIKEGKRYKKRRSCVIL